VQSPRLEGLAGLPFSDMARRAVRTGWLIIPFMHAQAQGSHPLQLGTGTPVSPPVYPSQALTVFRRGVPSGAGGASPRSSAFDLPAPGALGYSLSPVQGSLESSLMSASTPRYLSTLPNLPLPIATSEPLFLLRCTPCLQWGLSWRSTKWST
jgi:hypothetical protein